MKLCALCFEKNDNFLELASEEAINTSIESLVIKYVPFCMIVSSNKLQLFSFSWNFVFDFQPDPQSSIICGKCWCQIEAFHLFYTRLESIHHSSPVAQETVFVETFEIIKKEEPNEEIFENDTDEKPMLSFDASDDSSDGMPDLLFQEEDKAKANYKPPKRKWTKTKMVRKKHEKRKKGNHAEAKEGCSGPYM